jgi:hypothetical protein
MIQPLLNQCGEVEEIRRHEEYRKFGGKQAGKREKQTGAKLVDQAFL